MVGILRCFLFVVDFLEADHRYLEHHAEIHQDHQQTVARLETDLDVKTQSPAGEQIEEHWIVVAGLYCPADLV